MKKDGNSIGSVLGHCANKRHSKERIPGIWLAARQCELVSAIAILIEMKKVPARMDCDLPLSRIRWR